MQPAEFPLRRNRSRRVLVALLTLLIVPGVVFACVTTIVGDNPPPMPNLAVWIMAGALLLYWLIRLLRRSWLRLERDAVVISHAAASSKPLRIPREAISLVLLEVDDVWERGKPSPYPVIGDAGVAPNVAFMFREPIVFEQARRRTRNPKHDERLDSPPIARDTPVTGVLVALTDVHEARVPLATLPVAAPRVARQA